ncbi:hypothetical protein U9M48_016239 [Paspalum notatum var. saurae]|uniref:NAC domain-containing protein n=1 Tax=Paspalum notatum var. saurae TaxID=547442 RepID=A0AAQ3T8N9_PASNO
MSEVVSLTKQQLAAAPGGGDEIEEPRLQLPPGFRFHPTDEEVVSHYLTPKALDSGFSCVVVADVDLNKIEPWDLPGQAKMGEKEWYFFCHKDRKYPTGMRTNRATASGYWKATGKDKEIYRGRDVLVGMKKTLVFYTGRAPHGGKTPWVMHEYRLEGKLPPNLPRAAKEEWAVCRVFNKDLAAKAGHQIMAPPAAAAAAAAGLERSDSLAFFDLDDLMVDNAADLPPLMDAPLAADVSVPQQQVKTEQQNQPPQPVAQDPTSYFSLPATNSKAGAAAPATTLASSSSRVPEAGGAAGAFSASFPELDDLLVGPDSFIDYSSLWTF